MIENQNDVAGVANRSDGKAERVIDFGPCRIRFDSTVLEPRPWTLLQSQWAAELSDVVGPGAILELCCGAGQIGLAAAVLSGRDLVQVDVDPVACSFAAGNGAAAGLADRIDIRCSPMDTSLHEGEQFPLIVADPPYLQTSELDRFPEDPKLAVDGGADGLGLARLCLMMIHRSLTSDGRAILQLAGNAQFAALEPGIPDGLLLGSVREIDDERALGLFRRPDNWVSTEDA